MDKIKDKEKEKEEVDKISSSPILVGQSEEYDSLLRDLNAREKVCVNETFIITIIIITIIIITFYYYHYF